MQLLPTTFNLRAPRAILHGASSTCRKSLSEACSLQNRQRRYGHKRQGHSEASAAASADAGESVDPQQLWLPDERPVLADAHHIQGRQSPGMQPVQARSGGEAMSAAYNEHKAQTPPPDLPSLMLDARIVYIGMPLVSAVTELLIAELLYLEFQSREKPINIYINSTGTTRADGEAVGFETEGTAIYDVMQYIKNDINTVGVGVAMGQACMLLSAGTKGKRFMLPHATAMLQQPRVPPTGQRQAVEIAIKWKEVLAQKTALLEILSNTTGHTTAKLDKDMQRPLYMRPLDAIEYGIVDRLVPNPKDLKIVDSVITPDQYDKQAGLVAR